MSARIAAAAALFAASFCASRFGAAPAFLAVAATLAATRRTGLAATRRTGSFDAGRFGCLDRLPGGSILVAICLDALEATGFEAACPLAAFVLGRVVFVPRAGTSFLTPREAARATARDADAFVLAVDFAAASERAAFAAEVGTLDFETLLAFAARVLIVAARALAFFFALSSADCLAVFVLAAPICLACFVLDDFTLFFAEAITSALLFYLPRCRDGADPHGGHDLHRRKP